MITIAGRMYEFFQNSKTDGAYMLLFALSLVVLNTMGKNREKTMVNYSFIVLLGVVCNPFTIWLLSLGFPALRDYRQVIVLIPVLVCVPYGATILLYHEKNRRIRQIMGVLLFVYVAICGNVFGIFGGNTRTEQNRYDDVKKDIVGYLDTCSDSLVLADDSILPFITAYGDNVHLLYGKDIMLFNGDLGIMDEYDDNAIEIHNLMWEPEHNMGVIADMAYESGCDIIVTRQYEGAGDVIGEYTLDHQAGDYRIYRRQ